MSPSCFERPGKGGNSQAISEMPHMCGPERMGIGWTNDLKQKEPLSDWDWVKGGQTFSEEKLATVTIGEDIVWIEAKRKEKMRILRIGDGIVVVQREDIGDIPEDKPEEVHSQWDFEEEVLTGPRQPKMVEVFQYNTDEPGAGKQVRLALEDFSKVPPPGKSGLIWCGTSLSDQAMKTVECSLNSRFAVEFCKAFTINSIGATYKPEINAEVVLKNKFKEEKIISRNVDKYQFLILELGVNEVTDAKGENERTDKEVIDSKMKALVNLADDLYKSEKLQKVVLLNRLPRCDKERKVALSLYSNKAMQSALAAKGTSGIEIRDLVIDCESELLFGCPGVKDHHGRITDNLHFRGPYGPKAFNNAAMLLLQSV